MNSMDVDQKISNFLRKKHAEFPELALSGRLGSRTVKHDLQPRMGRQMLAIR